MSKKGERNQNLQPSKAQKAYGGYLPSVEGEGRADAAEQESKSQTQKTLRVSQPEV